MLFVLTRAAAVGLEPDTGARRAVRPRGGADRGCGRRRDDLTPYGRALLLLTLDARKDPRGNELAASLLAEVKQTGDLAWWEVDHDPLLEDWADTSVEATATAVQRAGRAHPRIAGPGGRGAVSAGRAVESGAYWVSTKQTAMALYGLTAFMKARGETPSAFGVDVSVNGAPVKTVTFDAASLTAPDPVLVTVPGREGDNVVTLTKRGGGALYWSAAGEVLRHADADRAHRRAQASPSRASTSPSPPRPCRTASSIARRRFPARPRLVTSCWCGSPSPAPTTGATC